MQVIVTGLLASPSGSRIESRVCSNMKWGTVVSVVENQIPHYFSPPLRLSFVERERNFLQFIGVQERLINPSCSLLWLKVFIGLVLLRNGKTQDLSFEFFIRVNFHLHRSYVYSCFIGGFFREVGVDRLMGDWLIIWLDFT